MGLVADLLIRRWLRYGESTELPTRKVTEARELNLEDINGRTRLTGLKRPTVSQAIGAVAVAADTNSDAVPDDLGYSDVVGSAAGVGLTLAASVASPPPVSGTGARVRANRVNLGDIDADGLIEYTTRLVHEDADVGDQTVLTNPRLVDGGILVREFSGRCTTVDDFSWVTLLTLTQTFQLSRSFVATGHVACNNYLGPCWGILSLIVTNTTTTLAVTVGTVAVGTDVRVAAAGNDLVLQVMGPDYGSRLWFGRMIVDGLTPQT